MDNQRRKFLSIASTSVAATVVSKHALAGLPEVVTQTDTDTQGPYLAEGATYNPGHNLYERIFDKFFCLFKVGRIDNDNSWVGLVGCF